MYNIKGDLNVLRRIFSRFIRVESLSGNTGNVLAADNNGEIVSRNVDFFLTGSTIFNNKVNNSTFYAYTSATNTLIGTKLNISDFSSYSANTQNTINNNYSQFTGFTNNFYDYTSATNTLIGTKLDTTIFAAYTANTGSNVSPEFSAFTQTFYQYTADTNNLINTKLDKTTFTAFTNSFYSYSSNTLNTINNNYSQFTGFTNSFNSYSANTNALIGTKLDTSVFTAFTNSFYGYTANTQNTINNNYSDFTAFTNSFYGYTGDTNNLINTKLNISDFNSYSSNTLNTINNNYSQFTGFTDSFNSYSANTQNQLNNKYDKSGGTITGNVTILGDLIVNGTATTINTQNLLVYDPIIGLALVQSGSTNPTLDSGFIIERGLSGNTGFIWKEVNKQFELGYTNNTYNDINVNISQFGDLKVGGLKTNYIYDSLSSTGLTNYILTTTPTGIKWLSGTTTVDISGKLDVSVFTAFTNSFYSYSSNTQNTINSNYSQFTAFTNSFYSYSSNTLNTINNNYSQFTGFTNSFYSYSSNTQNTINSNYRQFTAFTNTFYVYSAQTDSRLLFSSGTVGSTFRVNNNNEASGQYSTVSGGRLNTNIQDYSFIGGGLQNTSSGCYSFIGGGCNNISSFDNTFILGSNITTNTTNTTYVENLNVKNNIYDSFGTTGTTGYLLSTTPTGVKWVSGATSTSLTPNFDYIDFTTGYTATAKTGRVYYDSNEQALSYFPNTSGMDVTVNIGQESLIRVYNSTGAQINNGSVVHISGSTGGLPTIVLANASDDVRSEIGGVATHDIPNNSIGFITYFGIVRDVNTSAFNVGDELYLSDTINGGFTNNVIGINFNSRVCLVGWVITSGTTNGKILVSITNENKVQSLTNKEVNILLGNTISTGVFEFTGLTKTSNTTFQIAPVRGWFVDNTSNPIIPHVLQVNYSGSTTGQTTPYLATADSTYVLLTSGGTISYQTSFPSPQERRQNIFLGKVVHPSRSSILNVNNTVDFDVSPMSALRDLWTPIKLVNQGIIVSPHSTTLEINTSAGTLWGNGIGWATNQLNPNSVSIAANSPASFFYRTQTGGTSSSVSVIDPTKYDVGGVITSMGGAGSDNASNQRVYLYPTGIINILYGQTNYPNLTAAVAGIQTESFVLYPNAETTGILIGIISVRNDIVADSQPLTNTNYARFTLVSKFGELLGGTGGLSTTTLQQAYDNSSQPEILTNPTLGAVTFRRGSDAETDRVIEVQNTSGVNTFAVTGLGDVSGNSFNVKTYIYDSTNTSGTTNQVLFTSPSGVRWNNIDGIVTGLTNNKVIELGSGILSTVRINANNITSGNYSGVLSGTGNTASGTYSVIAGGRLNIVTGSTSFLGGGFKNTSSGDYSVIGGGSFNNITPATTYSGIFSGSGNTTTGVYTFIGGGCGNVTLVTATCSNIGGGTFNTINGALGFIGGGTRNRTLSCFSAVAGGCLNSASAYASFVGGGVSNTVVAALGSYGSIGGGFCNTNSNCFGFIGGGSCNTTNSGNYSSIGGGFRNVTFSGSSVIGGGSNNTISGINSTIGGGCLNTASGNFSTVIGGLSNTASGICSIAGGRLAVASQTVSIALGNNNTSSSSYAAVIGGKSNTASGYGSIIGGGCLNRTSGQFSAVIGGRENCGVGACSFIGGGCYNSAQGINSGIVAGLSGFTGAYSAVVGGSRNTASGTYSGILGGSGNTVTGTFGHILGGRNNTTACNNSFILGSNITANAIDTTFTQCINACGQTLLQGTSASSGCALLVRNSTPLALYTALNTGQHLFNGTFTATANNTCGWNLNQRLTQRGTACDTLYATYINPTIIYAQHNQTNKALSVQTLFTGTTLTWTGATNIIADFGATNIGTQLTVSDVISGTIYGVNDVSGLPIIDATSNWDVNIYDFPNTVLSKTGKTLTFGVIRNSASTVTVQSDLIFNEGIGLGYRMSQVSGLTTGSSVSVLYQLAIPTGQTVFLTANTLGRANNANMDSTISEYKYTAKRSLTGSLTQVGVAQGFVNRDNNNTNVGIDISSNNIRLVVTGNTDTYLWASTIIAQTY